MFIASNFSHKEGLKKRCYDISVSIVDQTGNEFVDKKYIETLLKKSRIKYKNYFKNININELEARLELDPMIKKAEVYKNAENKMFIDVLQKQPIVRIMNSTKRGFYINYDGTIMPLSKNYTARVLVLNGHLNYSYSFLEKKNVKILKEYPYLRKLFRVSKYIYEDNFLKSQIEQIYVNSEKEIELIPRVGAHIIEFGKPDNIVDKFDKLYQVYLKGFRRKGWNHYSKIDLKFENQVVCVKR